MCSLKAFINENWSENCTREHRNISILYCTYREKTVIRANRVSYKKRRFSLQILYLAGILSPHSGRGWEAITADYKALGFSAKYS